MAEWIEILNCSNFGTMILSPLAMAEWIEILWPPCSPPGDPSPLAMAEWIEIALTIPCTIVSAVSASDGGVD